MAPVTHTHTHETANERKEKNEGRVMIGLVNVGLYFTKIINSTHIIIYAADARCDVCREHKLRKIDDPLHTAQF